MYIPTDAKKVHLLFSGGLDSTLLLFLLLKEIKETSLEIPVRCYTFSGTQTAEGITEILNWMTDRFSYPIYHTRTPTKRRYIRSIVEDILAVDEGYVYSACNKVIEGVFFPTNYIPGDTPPVRGEPFNEKHLRPFIHLDKISIIKMYKKNCIENLIPLTYSCGFRPRIIGECGKCYFCMEKQWGMKGAGIITTEKHNENI